MNEKEKYEKTISTLKEQNLLLAEANRQSLEIILTLQEQNEQLRQLEQTLEDKYQRLVRIEKKIDKRIAMEII